MRYMRIKLFAELTGYSEKAVRRKIEEGIFVEGIHFKRAPDNCILIDATEFERWVEGSKSVAGN